MEIRRKIWVSLTLACFFVGASFWLLAPSSPSKVSAAGGSAKTTLFANQLHDRLQFVDAADLPENIDFQGSIARPTALANADINGDGWTDLLAAYTTEHGSELRVRYGAMPGVLSMPQSYSL